MVVVAVVKVVVVALDVGLVITIRSPIVVVVVLTAVVVTFVVVVAFVVVVVVGIFVHRTFLGKLPQTLGHLLHLRIQVGTERLIHSGSSL